MPEQFTLSVEKLRHITAVVGHGYRMLQQPVEPVCRRPQPYCGLRCSDHTALHWWL